MKKNTKKGKKKTKQLSKNKVVILLIVSVFLLILSLFCIKNIKSDSKNIVDNFNKYFSSDEIKVIYYYDSSTEDNKVIYGLNYLIQIKKDFDIDYLSIDKTMLNDKTKTKIENQLGINGISPTTIIVKDKKVIAVQEGFIESHKLVELFTKVELLEKDSKFSMVDNLKFINYEDYVEMFDDEKKHIIVIGEAGCQYCYSIKPIINNISKAYKVDINYLDVADLTKEELKELFDKLPELGYDDENLVENQVFNMPTMLLVSKGKIVSYLSEAKDLNEYVKYLKTNEFIE